MTQAWFGDSLCHTFYLSREMVLQLECFGKSWFNTMPLRRDLGRLTCSTPILYCHYKDQLQASKHRLYRGPYCEGGPVCALLLRPLGSQERTHWHSSAARTPNLLL
ncbi:hypothetical protein GPALN_014825 [Globodera pallida]|nr:hypothetical protein GPALN_014825 [Globodera pallida]